MQQKLSSDLLLKGLPQPTRDMWIGLTTSLQLTTHKLSQPEPANDSLCNEAFLFFSCQEPPRQIKFSTTPDHLPVISIRTP
ncbi:hypothetical protein OS493_007271 [Desmophyllum pertusum]|uniref:Uncharacterized protein n=1 Tax=Desmophyllum pertusum TaxID=174260 RepID=A0A9W9Z5J6_9CNID|nr:hypothetical protein OS493_007271 [Desmophyllum pertusum]